ncbi:protein-glutamate O-methyltransferase CheR [Taibaiella lutea]|uniref:Protein-glutamate O-methyltransferase CheR n=1 Tax=Taibaiella lutea TaxID=2608001 RepID=A0A5M6CTY5_9BACT|nr:protein-glutamate O-methyltransferase CheR [Taibaiella lutea]KAA5536465.1 protein-glutamate O-methyltransferase CheR [Taibaiella lutea]
MTVIHEINTAHLPEIIAIIKEQYGYDFSGYAEASFQRRLNAFMHHRNIKDVYSLKYFLLNDKDTFSYLLEKITVNVTTMFRNPDFFLELKEKIFPILASYPVIRIWHAGCATGQEVYSVCILLKEAGLLHRTNIYATDINPQNIKTARAGSLPLSEMKEYIRNYNLAGGTEGFSEYYNIENNRAVINKDLLSKVIFSRHNLVTESSFNEFNLILCRNVMIYFNRQLQDKVIGLFNDSLTPGGFLALGDKESLITSAHSKTFTRYLNTQKVYKKKL